ncbi:tetratricopeptide repeat protein [Streptomyces sp. NPDC088794]|uniref:tetratricopeptide repeat protein n=1 Tax=Streptomyces sp. NPDC088794 TaxID=3365902 RepID=UPI0037F8E73F
MSRLSREKKREQQRAERSAALMAAPIDVHVPGTGPATVGGVPITAAPGEELQLTVLNHLHRIALTAGHPVHATVRDERIGYVVQLQVAPDGSSDFTGEPVPLAPPVQQGAQPEAPDAFRAPEGPQQEWPGVPDDSQESPGAATPVLPPASPTALAPSPASTRPPASVPALPPALPSAPASGVRSTPASASVFPPAPGGPAPAPARPVAPESPQPRPQAQRPRSDSPADKPTHVFPPVAEPGAEPLADSPPTFRMKAVSEPLPLGENVPTFPLRAVPEWVEDRVPGTVVPPLGEFGPPPQMDAIPLPALPPEPEPDPDSRQTPARGFDAVAEAVFDDAPSTVPPILAEPMTRINEAVKDGRIDAAAELAERTVGEGARALGPEHPEVLRLRELTSYIAYLAGDPVRSFHLSLDLARIRRHTRDAEAAYGNIQSAASAWRAVRDPEQGLSLGRELIDLWTELTAEDGPAAEDIEQLEAARARMGRLTERARRD